MGSDIGCLRTEPDHPTARGPKGSGGHSEGGGVRPRPGSADRPLKAPQKASHKGVGDHRHPQKYATDRRGSDRLPGVTGSTPPPEPQRLESVVASVASSTYVSSAAPSTSYGGASSVASTAVSVASEAPSASASASAPASASASAVSTSTASSVAGTGAVPRPLTFPDAHSSQIVVVLPSPTGHASSSHNSTTSSAAAAATAGLPAASSAAVPVLPVLPVQPLIGSIDHKHSTSAVVWAPGTLSPHNALRTADPTVTPVVVHAHHSVSNPYASVAQNEAMSAAVAAAVRQPSGPKMHNRRSPYVWPIDPYETDRTEVLVNVLTHCCGVLRELASVVDAYAAITWVYVTHYYPANVALARMQPNGPAPSGTAGSPTSGLILSPSVLAASKPSSAGPVMTSVGTFTAISGTGGHIINFQPKPHGHSKSQQAAAAAAAVTAGADAAALANTPTYQFRLVSSAPTPAYGVGSAPGCCPPSYFDSVRLCRWDPETGRTEVLVSRLDTEKWGSHNLVRIVRWGDTLYLIRRHCTEIDSIDLYPTAPVPSGQSAAAAAARVSSGPASRSLRLVSGGAKLSRIPTHGRPAIDADPRDAAPDHSHSGPTFSSSAPSAAALSSSGSAAASSTSAGGKFSSSGSSGGSSGSGGSAHHQQQPQHYGSYLSSGGASVVMSQSHSHSASHDRGAAYPTLSAIASGSRERPLARALSYTSAMKPCRHEFGITLVPLPAVLSASSTPFNLADPTVAAALANGWCVNAAASPSGARTGPHQHHPTSGGADAVAAAGGLSGAAGAAAVTSAQAQGDAALIVTGGHRADHSNMDLVQAYLLRTHTWHTLPPLPTTRSAHAALYLNGAVYLLGGMLGTPQVPTATCVRFDLATQQYQAVAPMSQARYLFSACVVDAYTDTDPASGTTVVRGPFLVVAGGMKTSTCERYDPARDRWTPLPSLNRARHNSSLCPVNGKLWLVGDHPSGHTEWLSVETACTYEPAAATATATATATPRWTVDTKPSPCIGSDHEVYGVV